METAINYNQEKIRLTALSKDLLFILPTILLAIILSNNLYAQPKTAESKMRDLGPENSSLQQMVGNWEVTETVWASKAALPVINNKYAAQRRMIGSILQEIMYNKGGSPLNDIERIDYLSFNRIEGRWKYLSMDARVPVGLMPAASFTREEKGKIVLLFEPFSVAGSGTQVTGQMLRMDETITVLNNDHVIKEQRFIFADGTATPFLAHRYDYIRKK